ncbi:MAG TPA: hypothetical protein VF553_02710 [Pyrinomonadaceae bacterium]|jgi:hypothetical protein
MNEDEMLLIDEPLAPDPDADEEMGPGDVEAIADEDLKGSRLLLVRRAAEAVDLDGTPGGAVEFACTFQPGRDARFTWARLLLRLNTPAGIHIVDLAPRVVREDEPVRFTLDRSGKLGLSYQIAEASVERGTHKEYAVYNCSIQGSGEGTSLARWDFNENPHRKDGLGREQVLALTLPVNGSVTGTVSVNARVTRPGLRGRMDAIRDLVLGTRPEERHYAIAFEIPQAPPPKGLARFLRLF